MIRIAPAPEPPDFDRNVRRRARKLRFPTPPVAAGFWKGKEYWRHALDALCEAYDRQCAYTGFRIEAVTGARTVDHFLPKQWYPAEAYEWLNFRLVCAAMNSRKGTSQAILDPFTLPSEVFDLNPANGHVIVHRNCPAALRTEAEATIEDLGLNRGDCPALRLEQTRKVFNGDWSPAELARQSAFVFYCLDAQGLL